MSWFSGSTDRQLNLINNRLNDLYKQGEEIMSALTDLQAKFDKAAADVSAAMTAAATKLDALAAIIANNPSAADLTTVSADLSTTSDNLETAAAALQAKVAQP
jgi:hypothetical protein